MRIPAKIGVVAVSLVVVLFCMPSMMATKHYAAMPVSALPPGKALQLPDTEGSPMVVPSGVPMAPTSTKTIDDAISGMEWGETAFDVPTEMAKGKPYRAALVLSLSMTAAELVGVVAPGRTNDILTAKARISNVMEAALTGYGFAITATTPETQAVSGAQPTTWLWEVVPQSAGRKGLHLALSAFVPTGDDKVPFVVRTLDREVVVKVTPAKAVGEFFKGNWQWLWATLLAPAWLWGRSRKKAKRKAKHARA